MVARNITEFPITFDMTFYPNGGGASTYITVTLAGYESIRFNDILYNEFGLDSVVGYIIVDAMIGEAPAVTARTYTIFWDQFDNILGTFGQYIPAADLLERNEGPAASTFQDLVHLVNGAVGPSSFRTKHWLCQS
jgi:hypothetical protein